MLYDKWWSDAAAILPLNVRTFTGRVAATAPDAGSPISVEMEGLSRHYSNQIASTAGVPTRADRIQIQGTFTDAPGDGNDYFVLTATDTGSGAIDTEISLDNFGEAGDKLLIHDAEDAGNNSVFTVGNIATHPGTADIIGFEENADTHTDDTILVTNLSRSDWFDNTNQNWECAVSTLYDDNKQESALHDSGDVLTPGDIISDTTSVGLYQVRIKVHVFAGLGKSSGLSVIYPRVSGFNIYMRQQGAGTWYLQANVDISKGIKWVDQSGYEMWNAAAEVTESAYCTTSYSTVPKRITTYESNSGNAANTLTVGIGGVGAGFKTAVVANRMAYVGNVKTYDKDDNLKVYGDAVFKSHINKFDSFTVDRMIEASVNDGDEIVKLEEYADRLLIFKKTKMELLNISQEVEFLEDTFRHKGVAHPFATCKTDFGIAWVNNLGCYLYDGERVSNLLEKGGRQIIKESDWLTFTTNDASPVVYEPMIGYIPKKRQLLVVDDNSADGAGKIFLYDMVTKSWIKGAASTLTSTDNLTNFITDWNGDLVYTHTDGTGTPMKWADNLANASITTSSAVDIKTKDIDFGQPGQVKRIYKFYVTHRGTTSEIQLSYAINGDQDATFPTEAGSELAASSAVTDWITTAITPTAPFSCTSLRLRLFSDGNTPANFEINDISIVYRLKGAR